MIRWLVAFALTQLIEIPIYRRALGARRGAIAIGAGASALTHPVVWFAMPWLFTQLYLAAIAHDPHRVVRSAFARYALMVALAESFAVLAEAVYLRAFGLRRALAWSLLANGCSVTVGFALRAAIGWP